MTTASVIGIEDAGEPEIVRQRGFAPDDVSAQDGTVSHWPLWWQDPFVDMGSADDPFAWTVEDYIAFPYGFGRFLVNTMGFPVSVVVQPPWTVMGSDGVLSRQALGYDHDAAPLPGGMPPPADFMEVGAIPGEWPILGPDEFPSDELPADEYPADEVPYEQPISQQPSAQQQPAEQRPN